MQEVSGAKARSSGYSFSVDQMSERTPPDTNECTNMQLPVCIHVLAQSHLTCRDLLFRCFSGAYLRRVLDVASQPVASFGRSRWEASLITTSAHGVAGRTVGTLLMVLITPSALKVHFHAFGITGMTTTVRAKQWLIFSTRDGLCIMCL